MKHGILSTSGNYIMEATEPESIPHYAAKVLCVGDGNERRTPGEAEQLADRIVLATNAYDALVAQRDALVEALAELVDRFRSWSLENADDNGLPNLEIVVPVKHIQAGIAALDLAKGNDEPR